MIPVLHLVDGMCSESLYTHIPVLKVIFMMRSRINEQRRLRHQGSLISFPIPFYATDTPVSCDELHTFSQYESRFATHIAGDGRRVGLWKYAPVSILNVLNHISCSYDT